MATEAMHKRGVLEVWNHTSGSEVLLHNNEMVGVECVFSSLFLLPSFRSLGSNGKNSSAQRIDTCRHFTSRWGRLRSLRMYCSHCSMLEQKVHLLALSDLENPAQILFIPAIAFDVFDPHPDGAHIPSSFYQLIYTPGASSCVQRSRS